MGAPGEIVSRADDQQPDDPGEIDTAHGAGNWTRVDVAGDERNLDQNAQQIADEGRHVISTVDAPVRGEKRRHIVRSATDQVIIHQVHGGPRHHHIEQYLIEAPVKRQEIPRTDQTDQERCDEDQRRDQRPRTRVRAPTGRKRLDQRDHRQRTSIQADRACDGHTRCEQEHDRRTRAAGQLRDRLDHIASHDCRSDQRTQDHRHDRPDHAAPIAGPECPARAGVGRKIA